MTMIKTESKTGTNERTNELEYIVDERQCAGIRCSHLNKGGEGSRIVQKVESSIAFGSRCLE